MTLLTRVGCHLCDEARTTVARVAGELGVGWAEVDVDSAVLGSAALADTYRDHVPVTLVDGRELGYWWVDEQRLRRALTLGVSPGGRGRSRRVRRRRSG